MRRLLDINTWIALSLEAHPQHHPARLWYEETPLLRGDLVFCRQTELDTKIELSRAGPTNQPIPETWRRHETP
jgi:hypothetical protein